MQMSPKTVNYGRKT